MAKSILQQDRDSCFLCGMNRNLEPIDEHHVFSGPYKKQADKYGLTVFLHHFKCHIFGKDSAHKNIEVRMRLCKLAQEIAMKRYGWTVEEFREIFGRSYL